MVLTDPLGNSTTNSYDAEGNLVAVTDANGFTSRFDFDGVGRRIRQIDALNRTNLFTWDNNDNLLCSVDALGFTNAFTYDGNNNRTSSLDPRNALTTNIYDLKDRVVCVINALGNAITNVYDALDRKIRTADARGNVTWLAYDAIGNLVAVTNALGHVTRYVYDADGNQTSVINPLGRATTNVFDTLNRLIATVDPLGHTNRVFYDALGRKVQTVDALSRTNQFAYDAAGRLIQVTDAKGGITAFSYDAAGNRLVTTDPNGHSTTNTFDALNRLVQVREPGGGVYEFKYDGAGNRTSQTDPNGQTILYSYDASNRRTSNTYPTGAPVTFAYDANGNLVQMTDSLGVSTYQYDALNRLTSVTDAFGKTVEYAYDAAGNRVSIKYPGNKSIAYGYDALNRMASVTDWQNATTAYAYDAAGNLIQTLNPNATQAAYAYDAANRLIGLTNTAPYASIISSYSYSLDAVGNHLQVHQTEPLDPVPVAGTFSYAYDADNRMISAGGVPHAYDANGNTVLIGATNQLVYDYENRLTQTVFGPTNVYQYDGMGNRRLVVRDGVTNGFVLDVSRPLSQILATTDGSGSVTAYYVYGLGLISKIEPGGATRYYHYDSRGSTVAITDSSGAILNTYAYDPFGQVAAASENTENMFRYLGRYGVVDEHNGLNYVRARYYSTKAGRFVTKDHTTGKDADGQSMNRYVYAMNNPVRLIDISGLSPLEGNQSLNTSGTSDMAHSPLVNERLRQALLAEQLAEQQYLLALQEQDITYEMWINIFTGIQQASASTLTLFAEGPQAAVSPVLQQLATLARISGNSTASQALQLASDTTGTFSQISEGNILGAISGVLQQASTVSQWNGAPSWLTQSLSTASQVLGVINPSGNISGSFGAVQNDFELFSLPANIYSTWHP
jgi:RHS repeat-associated protein